VTGVQTCALPISAVGVGMRSHTGVASNMFKALMQAGVNIHGISTSEIVISCLVDAADGAKALTAVHNAFGLSNEIEHRGYHSWPIADG